MIVRSILARARAFARGIIPCDLQRRRGNVEPERIAEAAAVWPVSSAVFALALAASLAACNKPKDIRQRTLDPLLDLAESDSVVLAYPMSKREVRGVTTPRADGGPVLAIAEIEVTLRTLHVLKGPPLPPEVKYRFYGGGNYIQVGPQQGPCDAMGAKGIYFLRRRPDGGFRSAIDLFLPDISTPWLKGRVDFGPCASPQKCLADVLLTLRLGDDARSFAAWMDDNVSIVHYVTGPLPTFDYLVALTTENSPEVVRHAACVAMSSRYPLEFPPVCEAFIAGTPAAQNRVKVARGLREQLKLRGLAFVRGEIRSNDAGDVKRYLKLLENCEDSETRAIAKGLLKKVS